MSSWSNNPFNPYRLPNRVTPNMLIMDRDGITGQPLSDDQDQPDDGTATSSLGIPNTGTSAPYDLGGMPRPQIRPTTPPQVTAQSLAGPDPETVDEPSYQSGTPPQVTPQMAAGAQQQNRVTIPQSGFGLPDNSAQGLALRGAQSAFDVPERAKQPGLGRSILAALASSTNLGRNFAPLIAYGPKGLAQERAYQQYQETLPEKLKAGQLGADVFKTEEGGKQRQTNEAFNETYKTQVQQEKERADRANEQNAKERIAAQKSAANRAFLEHSLKGREADAQYQAETAARPAGYEFVPDPEQPGKGFVLPPAWQKAPQELLEFLPGVNAEDMIPHSQYKVAVDARNKVIEEQKKPKPAGSPEQQFMDEYKGQHPGSSIAEAQKAFKAIQPPERPPHALMIGPDGKAIEVAPGTQVPTGSMTPGGLSTENETPAQVRSRQAQAIVINEAGNQLIASIDQNKNKIGNLASYWKQFVNGTPIADPVAAGLMAQLGTFAALQPALHGFRGQQALAEFDKLIGGIPKNAEALKASIRAIQGTATIVQGKTPTGVAARVDPTVKAYADKYFGGDVAKAQKAIEEQRKGKR